MRLHLTCDTREAKHRAVSFDQFRVRAAAWLASAALAGCASSNAEVSARPGSRVDRPGLPLIRASDAELRSFREGDALFEATVRESDGLGPLYVRDSCAACHQSDGRGPGFVTKLVPNALFAKSELAELLPFGSTERPFMAAGAKQALRVVASDKLHTVRRSPPGVFGRGYLEAIREQELERVSIVAAARTGTVRGRPNRLSDGKIGRFGVKARLATLEHFTADALNGDMGITTPFQPNEPAGPEGLTDDAKPGIDFDASRVEQLSDYVRLLEIPARKSADALAQDLFEGVGCADCHVPSLRTEPNFRVVALSDIDAPVYSDLLLHDMGEALSDGQYEADARPREFRTAPLIGLRFLSSFLHDGRARDVAEAIGAHGAPGSEARESFESYQELSGSDRARLVRFVETL